jgi:hypothetical protein
MSFFTVFRNANLKLLKKNFSCRSKSLGATFSPKFLFFLLLTILFSNLGQQGHCAQVSLTWDPNSESDLAGYKIYSGTQSGTYQNNIDVGNVTTYILNGLTLGQTYYIVATAYNTQGLESGFSNELVYTVPSCSYAISPSSASFPASGGSGSVSITTQASCNWGTSASASWLTINSGSGTGNGTMRYTVSPNTGTARSASLTVAGNVFTVSENGLAGYIITASAGSGGAISPSGQVSVSAGAGQTFTITPNSGYQVANVNVDGVSKGSITSYTFSSVSANHTIAASFSLISSATYTLSVSKNGIGNGNVSTNPVGTSFASGTGVTLTATPDATSIFGGWSGACSGTLPTCRVTMNSNLNVTATFSRSIIKAPVVSTGAVSSMTFNSATLNGTVNPNGLSTTYIFQWGRTTSYGFATAVTSAGSGTGYVAASARITGLRYYTVYHYRLVATNSAGTTYGADQSFQQKPKRYY